MVLLVVGTCCCSSLYLLQFGYRKRTLARGLKPVERRVCAVGSRLAPAGSPLLVFTEKARLAMDEALYNGILAALEAVHGGQTASEVRQSC